MSDPATADLGSFDVIVVCITAYLEAFEAIARRNYRGQFFYIYELMAESGGAPQSELEKLSIDYQRTRNGNLFLTLLSRPQFMTVVTYRLTRHCDADADAAPALLCGAVLSLSLLRLHARSNCLTP